MKKENWKSPCDTENKITAIGFAYHGGGWYNLGNLINRDHGFDSTDTDEPEIIVARIEQEEKTIQEDYSTGIVYSKRTIQVYTIYDQHDNLIYEFPVASMHVSYSPLMRKI